MQDPTPWPADARHDQLIGDWHVYQRSGGHRTSTDDLITAWYATHRFGRRPVRYLDLGCGVGSVLLMVSHKLQPKLALGIEAQAQSVLMARRSLAELPDNACQIRVEQGDFREVMDGQASYDLVTGSPPYFPLGTGVLPSDAQRRACRFEERGGVEAYFDAAARAMRDDARFYLVFQTLFQERVLAAAAQRRMHLAGQADFLMSRARRQPFLSVYEFSKRPCAAPHRFECAVRDADGTVTAKYQNIRGQLGLRSIP